MRLKEWYQQTLHALMPIKTTIISACQPKLGACGARLCLPGRLLLKWTDDDSFDAVMQVEDLKRFMPQILHIVQTGSQAAAIGNKNVGSAGSLAEVFSFSG